MDRLNEADRFCFSQFYVTLHKIKPVFSCWPTNLLVTIFEKKEKNCFTDILVCARYCRTGACFDNNEFKLLFTLPQRAL